MFNLFMLEAEIMFTYWLPTAGAGKVLVSFDSSAAVFYVDVMGRIEDAKYNQSKLVSFKRVFAFLNMTKCSIFL